MSQKIKVLIVDDSAIVRDMLLEKLSEEKDIEVIGTAPDPFIARDKIVRQKPDVITLDIEMPKMDGLTFLEKLMVYYPMPVIIVSSVTTNDKYAAIKALELGAFDVVNKPGGSISVKDVVTDVAYKIRQAFLLKEKYVERRKQIDTGLEKKGPVKHDSKLLTGIITTDRYIAIGASTGGTVALEYILKGLPSNLPPILIVQHMPPNFTLQFANRLNEMSALTIKEAEDEELVTPGTVYIAKGGYHLTVVRKGGSLYTRLTDTERIQFQKPSVDVLFHSIAENAGRNALGILLTGMGKDGAEGLLHMKKQDAYTITQDEQSSVVWGMPRAAFEIGASSEQVPLEKIADKIIAYAKTK